MRSFKLGQRIQVTDGDLKHQFGIIRRIRMSDHGAWVEMENDLPKDMQVFTDDERKRHVMLYPNICTAAMPKS